MKIKKAVDRVQLNLTMQEAAAIVQMCSSVSGAIEGTLRKDTDAIQDALIAAGVSDQLSVEAMNNLRGDLHFEGDYYDEPS